ncbi:MAG: UDP-N-acetylmuramoyl-L-alanyl-D-glutamate--2,6-diaminopimelate ligase [Phycisphaerales bacterium]|nr:MAG: UDP-N-acetylmuramoyl-L-alanyl-D-glutamate--2,6-diaminopimelate ligase [Phycisphaerales bacterium]
MPDRSASCCNLTLRELFARAGITPAGRALVPDVNITRLTDDSRTVRPGDCFVAIRGTGCDGHDFVEAASAARATAAVVEREIPVAGDTARVLVGDTREALARLASAYYGLRGESEHGLHLIGVTGTNGKTTVGWLLRSILQAAGQPTALIGTVEYDLVDERLPAPLTTPGPLALCRHLAAARDAGATYGIVEISSHALDQRRCDGLPLRVGVFTNLSGDHLDYHETMESYAAAKRRLFELLDADAVAVVNRDDPVGESLAESLDVPVTSYGLDSPGADVSARVRTMTVSGTDIVLRGRSFETAVHLSLLGRHNVLNALAAAATAEAVGMNPDAIVRGMERVVGVPGRLQRAERQGGPFSVLVDYAHTDAALSSVLPVLRALTRARLICVFGCGGDRDRSKRPRMAAAVGRLADVAYVTSDNPRTEDPQRIIDDILPGFGSAPACRVEVQVDRRCAIQAAIGEARSGDIVVIAGKGHETYQRVGDSVLPFDDMVVARECLNALAVAEEVA